MSVEQTEQEPQVVEAEQPVASASLPRTGHAAVDAVLSSLETLAARPVDEHVAIFEAAHEQLRGALDAPAGPTPPVLPGAPAPRAD